jgi:plastocyanin
MIAQRICAVALAMALLAGCGDTAGNSGGSGGTTGGGTTGGGASGGTTGGMTLSVGTAPGAESKYDQDSLNAAASAVTLNFTNQGALPHNWTLVRPELEQQAAEEGSASGPPQYAAPSALAQTDTLNSGGNDTISFTVEPGTYSYICTFPGHYALGMKGTLVVK